MSQQNSSTKPSVVNRRSKPWRNVLANWSHYLVTLVVAFFLSPFVVHKLGDDAYGAWVLLCSVVGYMGLLDLGVRGAATRYVAKFHAQCDHAQASHVASSALVVFLATAIVAIVCSAAAAVLVVPLFSIPAELQLTARTVLLLGGFTMAVSLISGVFEGVVIGLQRFDLQSGLNIAFEILRATLVVILLNAGQGLFALAAIQLGIAILRAAVAIAVSRQLYPELKMRPGTSDSRYIRMIFSFSFYSAIINASAQITMYSDAIVISSFLPVSLLAFFAIANNLTLQVCRIVGGVSQTFTPMTSAMKAQGQILEIQKTVLKGSRFTTAVTLPVVLTFLLRGKSFIQLWMGARYAEPVGDVLWVLALAVATQGAYAIVNSTVLGLNRHRGLIPFFLFEAFANLGLSIWLAQDYGIVGVAWGTTIPRMLFALFVTPWYARRVLGMGIPYFWISTWVIPALAMIPFALGSHIIENAWPAPGLAVFSLQVAVVLPLAAIAIWFVCLTADERYAYGAPLMRRLRRLSP